MAFWLMKSEPDVFSIDDLARDRSSLWEGVRNYQARNFMRDQMKPGDWALFYHSNAKPSGIAGIMEIKRVRVPDPAALKPQSHYFDPKATAKQPIWYCVEVEFYCKFPK